MSFSKNFIIINMGKMVHRLLCQRLLRNEKFVMLADVHLLLLSVQTLSQKSVKFSLLTNLAYFIL